MPYTLMGTVFYLLTHLILTLAPFDRNLYDHPHFTNGETKIQMK